MAKMTKLPDGARDAAVHVHWLVNPETKAKFTAAAKSYGLSASAFLDELTANMTTTDDGVTVRWSPEPDPEGLPIDPD